MTGPKRLLLHLTTEEPHSPPRPPPKELSGPARLAAQDSMKEAIMAPKTIIRVPFTIGKYSLRKSRRTETAAMITIKAKLPRPKHLPTRKLAQR